MQKIGIPMAAAAALSLGAAALPLHRDLHVGSKFQNSFQHIYVIMMENEGTAQIIGNPDLPYINQLAQNYGYENNYFGVTHQSLANYVALLSGSNWGTHSDAPNQVFNHRNLVDQLETHHITWRAYMESMPTAGYTGAWYPDNEPGTASVALTPPNALYALKHDPFMLMQDIRDNPARTKNVVPFAQFSQDLSKNRVPNFVWISPNVINDMHGQSTGPGAQVTYGDVTQLFQAGDAFIKNTVEQIMASASWKDSKSLIYITWDEAQYPVGTVTATELQTFTAAGPDAPIVPAGQVDGYNWPGGAYGGGQVPLIVIDNQYLHHFVMNTWADHYSLLRTIEQNWHLSFLMNAGDSNQVKTLPVPGEPR
jgi:hypothetical protein